MRCVVKKSGTGAVVYLPKKYVGQEVEVILPGEPKLVTEEDVIRLVDQRIAKLKEKVSVKLPNIPS